MLKAYINYPNPHFTVHGSASCGEIRKMQRPEQRVVDIDRTSISDLLERFAGKHYRFAAEAGLNDMWLELSFDDPEFERAVVRHVRHLLGSHYEPLRNAPIKEHECPS